MTIDEHRAGSVIVIAPRGRIDSTTSDTLETRLRELDRGGDRRVVVDLAGVDYISSAGLRVMLTLAKRTRDRSGALALCGLEDAVRHVFELAGFLPLFAVEATRDAAVRRAAGD
jgi:stage II sporulation protein AA (anti-sigma F factor antagonist)